jgi:DNA-binding beta-propeller fold protein YncE
MVGDSKVVVAGGNGKLVLLDYKTGRVISSTDIAPRVDEIAFSPGELQVYCASGTGVITVVDAGGGKLKTRETVPSTPGCHSVAVDPKTDAVWIAFAKGDKSYVQRFDAETITNKN